MIKHLFFGLSQTCKQLMTLLQLIRTYHAGIRIEIQQIYQPTEGRKMKIITSSRYVTNEENLFFFNRQVSKTFTLIFTAKKSYSYMGTNLIKPASGFFFMNFFPNPVIHYGKSPKNIQPSHSEAPNCPPVIEA